EHADEINRSHNSFLSLRVARHFHYVFGDFFGETNFFLPQIPKRKLLRLHEASFLPCLLLTRSKPFVPISRRWRLVWRACQAAALGLQRGGSRGGVGPMTFRESAEY